MPENLRSAREFADWAKVLAKTGHAILPRTYDLDDQMIHMIADGLLTEAELKKKGLDRPLPSAAATFGASTAFIIASLSSAEYSAQVILAGSMSSAKASDGRAATATSASVVIESFIVPLLGQSPYCTPLSGARHRLDASPDHRKITEPCSTQW
jgi:hypothetical protein